MAEEVRIANTGSSAKIRSPLAVALLGLVTIGIYLIFWWYFINREMKDLGQAKGTNELGDSPGKSVLAITLGALIIVPAIMSLINTTKRVQAAQRLSGLPQSLNGWIALILILVFSPAYYAYMQSELNKVWRQGAGELGSGEAAPLPAAEAPASTPAPEQPAP